MGKKGRNSNAWLSVALIVAGAVAVIAGFLRPLLSDFDVSFSNLVVVEKKVVDTVFIELAPAAQLRYHTSPYKPSAAARVADSVSHSPARTERRRTNAAASVDSPDEVRRKVQPVSRNDAVPHRRPVSNLAGQNVPSQSVRSVVVPRIEEYVEARQYEEWVGDGPDPNYSVFDVGSSGMWQSRYNSIGSWTDDGRMIRKKRQVAEVPEVEIVESPEPVIVIQEDVIRLTQPVVRAAGTKLDENSLEKLRSRVKDQKVPATGSKPNTAVAKPLEAKEKQESGKSGQYEKFSVSELFADIVLKRAQKPFDYRSRSISGFDMVQVEGGRFVMGATDEQQGFASSDESPAHTVSVGSFLMSKYEVTQKQWNELMEDNPSRVKGDNYPVESVSFEQVQTFISRLNERTGMKFRLPTEAEWEYAARGGKHSRGYIFAGSDLPEEVLWSKETSKRKLHPVGSLAPNELGLYDMSGNVKEWVEDVYVSYGANLKSEGVFYGNSSLRVLRGGSCISESLDCRVSTRHVSAPSNLFLYTGFRLVCDL